MILASKLKQLVRDSEGAGFVEYIILVGLVALFCIAAYTTFGNAVTTEVQGQAAKVTGIN